jgi:CDP-diacylglycerol--glycerol-3-phosphate 3-phosphatidyltransferase
MIRKAKRRILISALYIGTEQGELVGELRIFRPFYTLQIPTSEANMNLLPQIEALREALTNNPHLRVSIITDLLRSTREQSPRPSTATMLLPLVAEFPDRVEACFYRSPKLKGLMERVVPRRYDEGWGLWHCKWYGADDEVLFSG